MTNITVFKKGDEFTKIICSGHTGYGVQGEDIVCASLSSIVQTGALGMLMVAFAGVEVNRKDEEGYLEIVVPQDLSPQQAHDVQIIFKTMMCGISDLHSEYSDFINLEVKDVY